MVIIKVNTGFVGGVHEQDTGLEVEEWKKLSTKLKVELFNDAIENFIEVHAVDEDDEEKVLD